MISLIKYFKKKKITVQQHYTPIYKFDYYKWIKKRDFPNAEKYYKNTISLPIFYKLDNKSLIRVINAIKNFTIKN